MSQENVTKFFAEIEKNPSLKAKYVEAMKEYQKESDKILAGKLIEVGKTSGFSFTDTDLHEAHTELMTNINENNELNDEDMAKVAGGFDFAYWAAQRGCPRPPRKK